MTPTIPVRRAESIADDIENNRLRILERAYDLFLETGETPGKDLDHWLTAERELVWTPAIELREENDEFKLTIAAAGIDAKDLKVQATAEDLLVKGETRHDHEEDKGTIHISEIRTGSLFRVIHLPRPIDPSKVKATFSNGVLLVTAPIAAESQAQKAKGEAA